MTEGIVGLHVEVSEDVLTRFKTAVLRTHGKLRLVQRQEIQKALEDRAQKLEAELQEAGT